jgi:hypothetical protein
MQSEFMEPVAIKSPRPNPLIPSHHLSAFSGHEQNHSAESQWKTSDNLQCDEETIAFGERILGQSLEILPTNLLLRGMTVIRAT